jgi:hypothetical protein
MPEPTEPRMSTTQVLEIMFGFWVLNKIHPRQRHKKKHHELNEQERKAAEEDDDADDAEESFEEPDIALRGSYEVTGGEAAGGAEAGEAGEFLALL